jgi:hypothetical protein
MNIQIVERTQQASVGRHGFGGPDTYVAVVVAPDGVTIPKVMNRDVLESRGIRMIHCGEGYAKHRGAGSALGRALRKATQIAADEAFLACLNLAG